MKTASEIMSNMDRSVNPCDNFYQFACGGYVKSAIIPAKFPSTSTSFEIDDNIAEELQMRLEENSPMNEPRPLKLVKNLYKSCMNVSDIENNSVHSLLKILKKAGGWPVIEGDEWNEELFNWTESVRILQKMGYTVNNMPRIFVAAENENSTRRAIHLSLEPSLRIFAINDNFTAQFAVYEKMVEIASLLGVKREIAEKEFTSLFYFVSRLHHINLRFSEMPPVRTNLSTLNTIFQTFSWANYIRDFAPSSLKLDDNDLVVVKAPIFIQELEKLMAETPKRVQANHIMWSIISTSNEFLKNEIRQIFNELETDGDIDFFTPKPRKLECSIVVNILMPVGLSAMYVRKNFNHHTKHNAVEMSTHIRNQFNQTLRDSQTLNPLIKERFLKKLEKMTIDVGFPNEFFNNSEFYNLYKGLKIARSDYLENYLNIKSYNMRTKFLELRESIRKRNWQAESFLHSLHWNAQFQSSINTVEIPSSGLSSILNKYDNPQYMKYGSIGTTIGHEIYHAFDSEGRDFDEDGNKIEWDEPSKKIFLGNDQCYINLFEKYYIGDRELNGKSHVDENMADSGGMKMAYLAYLDWSSKNEPEVFLPGLESYNSRQMFWISDANNWCEKMVNPNSYSDESPHAPNLFRVIGTYSNMPEFAEDFNCPTDSNMNPENKCPIW